MDNFLEKDVKLIDDIFELMSVQKINVDDIYKIIDIYNLFICSNKQYLYNRTYNIENLKMFKKNIEKLTYKRDMIYKLLEKINQNITNIPKLTKDVYIILDKFYILSFNLKFQINLYEESKFYLIKELIDTNLYNIDNKLHIKIVKYNTHNKNIDTIFIKKEELNAKSIDKIKNLIINELKEL